MAGGGLRPRPSHSAVTVARALPCQNTARKFPLHGFTHNPTRPMALSVGIQGHQITPFPNNIVCMKRIPLTLIKTEH